jgi:OFA family oxalate/formate antiporter-like MFS transporter
MITGLAVAGFGFGAMIWVKVAGSWGHLIAATSLSMTFVIYGLLFAGLVLIGSIWMVYPPDGWRPKGFEALAKAAGAEGDPVPAKAEFRSGQMLRTPQYLMIFVTFIFSAGAGLMAIGLMKLYPMEALSAAGYSELQASAIAGTAMAIFFSLGNGLGRIAWGVIADRMATRTALIIMTVLQGVMLLLFNVMAGVPGLLYTAAAVIGFNFGGNFALFPTITADMFGTRYIGENYPFVFLAYGVGGIFGPMLGGQLGDLGSFPLAFTLLGVLLLIGALIISRVKPPLPPEPERPAQAGRSEPVEKGAH